MPSLLAGVVLAVGLVLGMARAGGGAGEAGVVARWFAGAQALGVPGPASIWVCDRDADEVVGLDAEYVVAARFSVPRPTALAVRRDGQLWVGCAVGGDAGADFELWLLTQGGRCSLRYSMGALLDLALWRGSDAVILGRPPRDGALGAQAGSDVARVSLVASDGLRCELGQIPGATCVAGNDRGRVLVGTRSGALLVFDPARPGEFPRRVGQRDLASFLEVGARRTAGQITRPAAEPVAGRARVLDVAAGPFDGSWWALLSGAEPLGEGARLCLLGADLELRWWAAAGEAATNLIPVPGQERVWVVCARGRGARRFGPLGRREIPWVPLPMLALGPGSARADGGVALVSPGALLAVDEAGQARPGQGGFDFLVAAGR